jgi:hypothetical protein
MHHDRPALIGREKAQGCDKLKMFLRWALSVRLLVPERLFAAPVPTLVESHVEEHPSRPSPRLLVAADLVPVTPGAFKRPLREVLSRMDLADEQESLSNEAISLRAKEGIEVIAVTLLAAHRLLVSPLHLETPTRPEKGCTQLLGRARAERRSQGVPAPIRQQTTRDEYQKVASMTRAAAAVALVTAPAPDPFQVMRPGLSRRRSSPQRLPMRHS